MSDSDEQINKADLPVIDIGDILGCIGFRLLEGSIREQATDPVEAEKSIAEIRKIENSLNNSNQEDR